MPKVSTGRYFWPPATAIINIMMASGDDIRARLGQLVSERRKSMSLSVSAAARAAGIDRGTWTGLEQGTRETEEYNYSRIERVLGWRPGSIEQIVAGGDPVSAHAADTRTVENGDPQPAPDTDSFDLEIRMIERSDLPASVKRAMIQEAERLRDRQREERDALIERQAADRRQQIATWLKLAGGALIGP